MKTFATHVPPASKLDDAQRRYGRICAYASTWFGCYAEVMIDSSAIVIVYMTLLHSGPTMTMLSTSFPALAAILLTIPAAGIASRIGLRHSYSAACHIGCGGMLLMALAAFFPGPFDMYGVLLGCLIYNLSRPLYGVTWYPLLDNVLLPSERGAFFSAMRFSYLALTTTSFFLISLALGKEPPIWALQVVIAVVGMLMLGRKHFLDRLPVEEPPAGERHYDLWRALAISIRNRPLVGWAVYSCCIGLASSALLPLTMIYLKHEAMANAKEVQLISVVYMVGLILSHLVASRLLRRFGVRWLQPAGHLAFIMCALGLAFLNHNIPHFFWWIGGIMFLLGFATANGINCYSMELMALARPDNRTMATAFLSTYSSIGGLSSRFLTSFVLGAGMLVPHWTCGGIAFCSYQTLFLFFSALLVFFLLLLFLVPSIVPHARDYYMPY
ncbi:MAG: MFS transporter [Kiritimatiellia bacterium]|jgi:MFS family permease